MSSLLCPYFRGSDWRGWFIAVSLVQGSRLEGVVYSGVPASGVQIGGGGL